MRACRQNTDLDKSFEVQTKLFTENVIDRPQERVALADTTKILNDDDALGLFKETLPSESSFVQIQVSGAWDLLYLALRGHNIGSEQMLKMIDDIIAELKQNQFSEESKKAWTQVRGREGKR